MSNFKTRIIAALQQSPNIVIGREEIETTQGFPVSYFEELGLSKTDLKKLERAGLAIRGYWRHNKTGQFQVRYALLADRRMEDGNSQEGAPGVSDSTTLGGSVDGSGG